MSESKRDIAQYAVAARFQGRIARSLRERREQVESDHSIAPVPFANEPSLDAIQNNILCGDPETVAEKLVEFIRIVHPTHMLFYFQVGGCESASNSAGGILATRQGAASTGADMGLRRGHGRGHDARVRNGASTRADAAPRRATPRWCRTEPRPEPERPDGP